MADQFKLKAFVRVDGTGKVIPGGPILQAKKPTVGNWREINAKECCNYNPSTTTTTTTAGIPTEYTRAYYLNENNACNSTTDGSITFYSTASPNLNLGANNDGKTVFTNIELTVPVTEGYVLTFGNPMFPAKYTVLAGGVLQETICTTTTTTTTAYVGTYYNAGLASDGTTPVCNGVGPYSLPLIVDPNACSNGNITLAVGSYSDYGIPNGSTIYINLQNGNVIQVQTFGSVQMSMGCTSCG